jgi:hypothetical protein
MPIWVLLSLIAAAIGLIFAGPGGMLVSGIAGFLFFGNLRLLGAVFRGEKLSLRLPRLPDNIFDDNKRRTEDDRWDRFGGTRR